jgi:hypothetical protein
MSRNLTTSHCIVMPNTGIRKRRLFKFHKILHLLASKREFGLVNCSLSFLTHELQRTRVARPDRRQDLGEAVRLRVCM